MATSLDRALLTRAFERLGELAQSEGMTIEIDVSGGACIVLCSDIRISTRDVDAVFRTHDDAACRLADIVGRELMLPSDWLDQSVKRYVAPAGAPAPDLLPFGGRRWMMISRSVRPPWLRSVAARAPGCSRSNSRSPSSSTAATSRPIPSGAAR